MRAESVAVALLIAGIPLITNNEKAGVYAPRVQVTDYVMAQQLDAEVPRSMRSPASLYRERFAEGYLAGVVDATQGRLWCAPAGIAPTEVDDRVWTALRKRRLSLGGSAAQHLIEEYAAKFPCKTN